MPTSWRRRADPPGQPGIYRETEAELARRNDRRRDALVDALLEGRGIERSLLLDTPKAWLDTGGSAGQTAARLYCHRNTVLNRLRRLKALTGRSLDRVDHLVEWSLALLALDVLPTERAPEA
ncbi:MAG: helix-turn-helix domain-containing protein [Mycobacteriales bacterium]